MKDTSAKPAARRNSSIELLRILCMLLIVANHYVAHGGFGIDSVEDVSKGAVFIQCLNMFGKIACGVFALISGFFLVNHTFEKHYRKIVPLVAEYLLYSFGIFFAVLLVAPDSISAADRADAFHPLTRTGNWYVTYYILFYLFIPFLNASLRNLDRKQYTLLLVLLLSMWSVLPTVFGAEWGFGRLFFFLVYYAMGGYIRRFIHGKVKYSNLINLAVSVLSFLFIIGSVVYFNMRGVSLNDDSLIDGAKLYRDYDTIPAVIWSVSTFLFFANITFSSRIVDLVGASTLGIYLVHDNPFMRNLIWRQISPNKPYIDFPWIHAPVKILCVFLAALAVDLIRRGTVGWWFDRWFLGHCDRWAEKLRALFSRKARPSGNGANDDSEA